MMTRRALPVLTGAAIAISLAGCGGMGWGGKEQQTSERPSVSGAVAGSANVSRDTTAAQTPPSQQYPQTMPQSEAYRAPADYGPATSRRHSAVKQTHSQQQSMAGADRQTVRNVQQQLERRGYELGAIDGIYGPRTQRALTAFQRDENLRADGRIGSQTLAALGMNETGQQVGEMPQAATGVERRVETERRIETERPAQQTGQLPGTTGGTDQPQMPGTLPDTGSEAPGTVQPSERSGGIQGNEPATETPMGGTPGTPR